MGAMPTDAPHSAAPARPGVLGSVIAVLCLYEAAAETLNRMLDVDLFPSATTVIGRWDLRRMARALGPPRWVRDTAVLDVGFLIHLLGLCRRARSGARR